MTREKLIELRITDVRYRFNIDGNLTRLSFGFSDGSVSPKEGTYFQEPTLVQPISDHIKKLRFATSKTGADVFPCQIALFDRKNAELLNLQMGVKEVEATYKVTLEDTEHIVAAKIEVGKYYPINIHFLLFQHI